jgi:phosphoribosylformylglycinamidine cyclo-ligase
MVVIDKKGLRSEQFAPAAKHAMCVFEYIYFARPDSNLLGKNVHMVRKRLGRRLAQEHPVEADIVTGIPDSSLSAASGVAEQLGLPYEMGLIKNRYIGRTFIRPAQEIRELGVQLKLNPVRQIVAGKRVVLVDDSIVRGTTSLRIVEMLRRAGAKEVHVLISSPPVVAPCYYGLGTSSAAELIGARLSVPEIAKAIGADSLGYLSEEGMLECMDLPSENFCTACFNGRYPVEAEDGNCREGEENGGGVPAVGYMYKDAGVDIDAGNEAVRLLKKHVRSTHRPGVLGDVGGFGGLFALPGNYREPVLVAGTDGVGTKLKIAFLLDKHDTIGQDAVAMCVNDILVQGAEPLFFLDYLAVGKLLPERVAEIVGGVAHGCRLAGCALIGGETAEMPGFYAEGEYDLAGFAVGVVERKSIIDGSGIFPGDAVIGLPSAGLHSNGYSLARKVLLEKAALGLNTYLPELGKTLGEELLTPTKIYVKTILQLLSRVPVRGMAHITGGGLPENLPRCLPEGLSAEINRRAWTPPPIFPLIQKLGAVTEDEMFRTFNMGIGFVCVVPAGEAEKAYHILETCGEQPVILGKVAEGSGVRFL